MWSFKRKATREWVADNFEKKKIFGFTDNMEKAGFLKKIEDNKRDIGYVKGLQNDDKDRLNALLDHLGLKIEYEEAKFICVKKVAKK
jgi:hypothetical protein